MCNGGVDGDDDGGGFGFDLADAEANEITNAELSKHGYRGGCEKCGENAPLIMPLKNMGTPFVQENKFMATIRSNYQAVEKRTSLAIFLLF